MPDPLSVSVEEAAGMIGVSRTVMYDLIREGGAGRGALPSYLAGGRRLIRVADLKDWVAAQPAAPIPPRLEATS